MDIRQFGNSIRVEDRQSSVTYPSLNEFVIGKQIESMLGQQLKVANGEQEKQISSPLWHPQFDLNGSPYQVDFFLPNVSFWDTSECLSSGIFVDAKSKEELGQPYFWQSSTARRHQDAVRTFKIPVIFMSSPYPEPKLEPYMAMYSVSGEISKMAVIPDFGTRWLAFHPPAVNNTSRIVDPTGRWMHSMEYAENCRRNLSPAEEGGIKYRIFRATI